MPTRHLPLLLLCLLPSLLAAADRTPLVRPVGDGDSGDSVWQGAANPASFGELDANGDQKIDRTEWKAGRLQLEREIKETRALALEAFDQDQTGKLSRYEAAEAKPRFASLWHQARALARANYDADGDGTINRAEAKDIINRAGPLLAAKGARVGQENHVVTPDNVATAITDVIQGKRTMFSLCDVNNDGQLSQQEIGLAFDLLRAIAGE